jgi:hypothetical protein
MKTPNLLTEIIKNKMSPKSLSTNMKLNQSAGHPHFMYKAQEWGYSKTLPEHAFVACAL